MEHPGQPVYVAEAKKVLALEESTRVIELIACLQNLRGAFQLVGVTVQELDAFVAELSIGYPEDRTVLLTTPKPKYVAQLRQWSQCYLDSIEGSTSQN